MGQLIRKRLATQKNKQKQFENSANPDTLIGSWFLPGCMYGFPDDADGRPGYLDAMS
jgi:hypothetical protein